MINDGFKQLFIRLLIFLGKDDRDSFVLNYHNIDEKEELTPEFFEYQIEYYTTHGYQFVSKVEDLYKSKRILLTFDDAYVSFETYILPILSRHKIPCILFVPTKYIGRKLEDEISSMKTRGKKLLSMESLISISKSELITLGSHTHSHFNILDKSREYIKDDIMKSLSKIESITGKKCEYFSYPQGKVNDNVGKLIKELGFKYAFVTKNKSFRFCKSMMQIPRYSGDYFLNDLFLRLSRNSNCNLYMRLFN